MNVPPAREPQTVPGRRLFLLLLLGGVTLVSLLMAAYGPDRTWQLWNIPTMRPIFADARSITAGAESSRAGYDPLVDNPADPWHRVMNYPRAWQSVFRLGLNQRDTVAVAAVMFMAFITGLFLFVDRIERRTAWLLALGLFSPAVMLAIERANICLLVFFLCAAALAVLRRSDVAAALLLTMAGTLMYYPFLGLVCLARADRRRCLWLGGAGVATGLLYIALTWRDVMHVLRGIDRGTFMSYGCSVGWMAARQLGGSPATVVAVAVLCGLMLVAAVVALVTTARRDLRPAAAAVPHHLDGFRLGAAIYLGTFLLGNNWDYRLMFTLFCLPQLADWSRDARPGLRRLAKLTLVVLLGSLWGLFFFRFARYLPGAGYTMLSLDETANWLLWGCLLALVPAALPDWARSRLPVPAAATCPGTNP